MSDSVKSIKKRVNLYWVTNNFTAIIWEHLSRYLERWEKNCTTYQLILRNIQLNSKIEYRDSSVDKNDAVCWEKEEGYIPGALKEAQEQPGKKMLEVIYGATWVTFKPKLKKIKNFTSKKNSYISGNGTFLPQENSTNIF